MIRMGAFEAKTHFSEIIQRVSGGEEFVITKNGKPMARIIPPKNEEMIKSAIAGILELRKKQSATQKEIKAWKAEGRKH